MLFQDYSCLHLEETGFPYLNPFLSSGPTNPLAFMAGVNIGHLWGWQGRDLPSLSPAFEYPRQIQRSESCLTYYNHVLPRKHLTKPQPTRWFCSFKSFTNVHFLFISSKLVLLEVTINDHAMPGSEGSRQPGLYQCQPCFEWGGGWAEIQKSCLTWINSFFPWYALGLWESSATWKLYATKH